MGKPAARNTDIAQTCNDPTDLPVGNVIAVSTVMINHLPAAKQGDKVVGVDTHIIMIPAPPGPPIPTPLPHPFSGTIDNACSTTVKIEGKPAATKDSMASNLPPHIPQGGPFQKPPSNQAKIMLGSTNVMIGNSGGGGGGSGGGGGGGGGAGAGVVAPVGNYVDVTFVDKGGKPVTGVSYTLKTPDNKISSGILTGKVRKTGLASEGNCDINLMAITKAAWSTKTAQVEDKVKMIVETKGAKDKTKVIFQVMVSDTNVVDREIATFETKIDGDKAEHEWQFKIDKKYDSAQKMKEEQGGYSSPSFYFIVRVGDMMQRSGILQFRDFVEFTVKDADGNALANKKYKVRTPDGVIKEGTLDGDGHVKVEGVPPGRVKIAVDPRK